MLGNIIDEDHCANRRYGRGECMGYMSIKQTSEKWGVSTRRIQVLCSEERIPGATKIGSFWVIPEDAEKPRDERVKTGKYAKSDRKFIQQVAVNKENLEE